MQENFKDIDSRIFALKNEGNAFFKEKHYKQALTKYQEALNQCNGCSDRSNIKSTIYANMAMCYINCTLWAEAKKASDEALKYDNFNLKALYRRALALEKLDQEELSLQDLTTLIKCDPTNKEATAMLIRIRETILIKRSRIVDEQLPERVLRSIQTIIARIENPNQGLNGSEGYSLSVIKVTEEERQKVEIAAKDLRRWVIHRNKIDVLLKEGVVSAIVHLLKLVSPVLKSSKDLKHDNQKQPKVVDITDDIENMTTEKDGSSVHIDQNVLKIHLHIFRLLTTMVMVTAQQEEDDNAYRRKLLFDKPLEIPEYIQKARDSISSCIAPSDLLQLLNYYIRSGVTAISSSDNINSDNLVALRSQCTISALECLQYTGSLDNSYVIQSFAAAIACVESPDVVRKGLQGLGYLANYRRQRGRRVEALRKTQGLIAVMETTLQQLNSKNDDIENDAEFAITSLFVLFADKDRSPQDQISIEELATLLLGPYLVEGRDLEDLATGLRALLLLWMADRDAVRDLISSTEFLPVLLQMAEESNGTIEGVLVQRLSAELLMHCMEFPDLRTKLLDIGGVEQLIDICTKKSKSKRNSDVQPKMAVALARICVHGEDIRKTVFDKFDFIQIAIDSITHGEVLAVDNSSLSTSNCKPDKELLSHARQKQQTLRNYLELILFLSLHGKFKELLLDVETKRNNNSSVASPSSILQSLPSVGLQICQSKDLMSAYYFSSILCNLLRSRNDKERIRRPNDANCPQLDDDQVEALREFFEKLPEHSRPVQSGKFDRGEDAVVNLLASQLVTEGIATSLVKICLMKPTPTLNVLAMASDALRLLVRNQESRPVIAKAGAIEAFLTAASVFQESKLEMYKDDLSSCRQGLAHICISINPNLLSYREIMDIVPHLIDLLRHTYELYQYEAALALTNLISFSEEARLRVYHGSGISALMDVATSDNNLCRAAGLEGMCNMALCEPFREKIAKGGHAIDLQLLLAFLGETENARAQSAAAGCLAMLSVDFGVVKHLAEIQNVRNLLKALNNTEDFLSKPAFQWRLMTILNNICEMCSIDNNLETEKVDTIEPCDTTKDNMYKPTSSMLNLYQDILTTVKAVDKQKIKDNNVLKLLNNILEKKTYS